MQLFCVQAKYFLFLFNIYVVFFLNFNKTIPSIVMLKYYYNLIYIKISVSISSVFKLQRLKFFTNIMHFQLVNQLIIYLLYNYCILLQFYIQHSQILQQRIIRCLLLTTRLKLVPSVLPLFQISKQNLAMNSSHIISVN